VAKRAARRLKVFQAQIGFFDTVVAAPSQAAALRAWGVHQDLFANGGAKAITDELALAAALSEAAGAEVDLVRLDVDAPQLGAEVARTGLCLFEAAPGTFAAFRAEAIARWIDFEETMAPHRAVFLRRLAARAP
jgi:hypothetical protein